MRDVELTAALVLVGTVAMTGEWVALAFIAAAVAFVWFALVRPTGKGDQVRRWLDTALTVAIGAVLAVAAFLWFAGF